ncbi:hypothetical protein HNQ55_002388 [Thalassotalea piscium]|uniref:Uncharacterized protein n=1 Tax=Thalassotalea piscium TaxID=1230533 RepID=A0A7X0NI63_9GAMM|nr:hypothetical protein [Thalassotalea piscium]
MSSFTFTLSTAKSTLNCIQNVAFEQKVSLPGQHIPFLN